MGGSSPGVVETEERHARVRRRIGAVVQRKPELLGEYGVVWVGDIGNIAGVRER